MACGPERTAPTAPAGQAVWGLGSGGWTPGRAGAGGALPESTERWAWPRSRSRWPRGGAVWSRGASKLTLSRGCSRPVLFLRGTPLARCWGAGRGSGPRASPRLPRRPRWLPQPFSVATWMVTGQWVALGTEHGTGEVHADGNHTGLREPGTRPPRDMQAEAAPQTPGAEACGPDGAQGQKQPL